MKKNLAMSIALLFLAVVTCCGVTFAYFSAYEPGSDNMVQVGEFSFTVDGGQIINDADLYFKAPTIINISKIDSTYVGTATENFKTDGDDEFFNNYVTPFTITVKNTSNISMKIMGVNVSAVSFTTAGSVDYSSSLMSFVFNSAPVNNDYATSLRTICLPELPTTGSAFNKTKTAIATAQTNQFPAMAAPSTVVELAANATASYSGIAWIDYRPYKTIVNNVSAARPVGEIKIQVSVTVTQYNEVTE